ncbi:FAD-dependent oxidoreductase [Crystallibacter crystallopoietes]|uniref:FAD-dependent oxidoreductase n=1 Tax=Crystallibacter crystallopoietes TaxID=37928 RepID=UPI0009DB0CB9|nr:FAD-dependent oxidoreductase [Arthrobacter crystallopoietes]
MNPLPSVTTDVVVVGLGAWGSQALWRLAARGINVVGVERFGIGHHLGSTHGSTRLFRVACMEHPGLTRVAERARDLWYELGDSTDQVLLRQTGGLMVGPPDGHIVSGTLAAASISGSKVEVIEHDNLIRRYPTYAGFGPEDVGVWDPAAGITYPEKGVRSAIQAAQALGATVLTDSRVTDISFDNDGAIISIGDTVYRAQQVVLTAGPWMPHFVQRQLVARRTPMFWFEGADTDDTEPDGEFDLSSFPVFIRELPGGKTLWGHGARKAEGDNYGVKIGMEDLGYNFSDADADDVDRYIHPVADYGELSELVSKAFLVAGPRSRQGLR